MRNVVQSKVQGKEEGGKEQGDGRTGMGMCVARVPMSNVPAVQESVKLRIAWVACTACLRTRGPACSN